MRIRRGIGGTDTRFPGFADGPVSWGGLRCFSFPLYMLAGGDAAARQQIGADNERRDEIREGLASYTGLAAWANSPGDAHRAAATTLAGGELQRSFVGNFEAASGPGCGDPLTDAAGRGRSRH